MSSSAASLLNVSFIRLKIHGAVVGIAPYSLYNGRLRPIYSHTAEPWRITTAAAGVFLL